MDKFVNVQRQLPFEGYTLDYVKFLTETENEVSCTIILRKGEQGMPDATTKMFFTPVLLGDSGVWFLLIQNIWSLQSQTFISAILLKQRYDNYKKTTKKR